MVWVAALQQDGEGVSCQQQQQQDRQGLQQSHKSVVEVARVEHFMHYDNPGIVCGENNITAWPEAKREDERGWWEGDGRVREIIH